MANLKSSDKLKLENYLEMKGGYVCDFTNRTFGDFVLEHSPGESGSHTTGTLRCVIE
jgi:hypothetical protein